MSRPRLAPPVPRRGLLAQWRSSAKLAGIKPMSWQLTAARFLMATYRGRWLYPEVAIVAARQNGKSEILIPRLLRGLEHGERMLHSAQNRSLPREIFERVADLTPASWLRRPIRLANGQERIETWSGGVYRIVAPTRGGARGPSNDLVICDETREFDTFEFVAAAAPTLTASSSGQMIYLSNAGDISSIVLNGLRDRAANDPRLAYLEWSAAPELGIDDHTGWAQANPALGVTIRLETLESFRRQYLDQPAIFETEHLCRWVGSLLSKLVSDVAWARGAAHLEQPLRPALGIAVDPDARRISAVFAWAQSDGTIGLTLAAEVHGSPVDVDEAGRRLRELALNLGVSAVGYSPATDRDLARHLEHLGGAQLEAIAGAEFAAASSRFAATVDAGRLRWSDALEVGIDLAFTVRRDQGSAWVAVPADEARPVTAALAAVRAVWLATSPRDLVPEVH